jgi:hypothetical protein
VTAAAFHVSVFGDDVHIRTRDELKIWREFWNLSKKANGASLAGCVGGNLYMVPLRRIVPLIEIADAFRWSQVYHLSLIVVQQFQSVAALVGISEVPSRIESLTRHQGRHYRTFRHPARLLRPERVEEVQRKLPGRGEREGDMPPYTHGEQVQ